MSRAASFIRTEVPNIQYRDMGSEFINTFLRMSQMKYANDRQREQDELNRKRVMQEMRFAEELHPLKVQNENLRFRERDVGLRRAEFDFEQELDWISGEETNIGRSANSNYMKYAHEAVSRPEARKSSVSPTDVPESTPIRKAQPVTSLDLPEPLKPFEQKFIEAGERHGVNPKALAAIAMHETGNGTSSAFRSKNNLMGVSNSKGLISFAQPEESIERMARVMASPKGPYRNAHTLADIGRVYAPIGADNDPSSLNQHWNSGVSKFFTQLGGDPSQPIKGI